MALMSYAAPIFGGVALGVGYGNIGGITDDASFKLYFSQPSDETLQFLSGAMQAGSIVGSILGGPGMDNLGRRGSCLVSACILVLGCALTISPLVLPSSMAPIFVGRVLVGIGGGMACCSVPAYVSESVLPERRGAVESSFQLAVEIGILLAYILNYCILTEFQTGWCWSLVFQLPVSAAFLVVMTLLPESPRWLLRGHEAQANSAECALSRLRPSCSAQQVADELQVMRAALAAEEGATSWRELCTGNVAVAVVVLAMQVGTGIDMITVYAPEIFDQVMNGSSEKDNLLYTIYVGITFVVFTPVAIVTVDRCGRKPLLLIGSAGMSLSLLMLTTPLANNGALAVFCVLAFVAFFSFSVGPIAWVIPSEMVSSRVRARALAVGTVANWIADYVVVSTFLSVRNALGQAGAFGVYAGINIATLVFVVICVPETKGMELDHEPAIDKPDLQTPLA